MKNIVSERKIELLKKYFPLDEENKIFTIKLYYDKASDLLDYSIGELTHEMFSEEFIDKLSSTLEMIPFDYKADIILDIKDYDVYNEEMILDKFNDLLEILSFKVVKESKKRNLHALIITFFGILVFVFNILVGAVQIFGEGLISDIVGETLSIISTVFIWEAVGEVFLTPSEDSSKIMNIAHYINSIGISRDGTMGIIETREQIIDKCKSDIYSHKGKINVLLITSIILTYLGGVGIAQAIVDACTRNLANIPGGIVSYIISIVLSVIQLLMGIGSIITISSQKQKMSKFIIPFVIASFIVALVSIIVSIIVQGEVITTIGHSIALICLVVIFFAYRQKHRKIIK